MGKSFCFFFQKEALAFFGLLSVFNGPQAARLSCRRRSTQSPTAKRRTVAAILPLSLLASLIPEAIRR
jgi:hypothetical protein